MRHRLFIAGTDTEVGKTVVATALLGAANKAGLTTAGVKPVAAGCDPDGTNEDARALIEAMSLEIPYQQVNPIALEEAIAPHIAARHENRRMSVSQLAGYCQGVLSLGADVTVVEGAGGWRVPLNHRETLADLARELQLDVVMVVGMQLGCINHALLSVEAIQRDGLRLAGWVANRVDPEMPCFEENLESLQQRIHAPLLGNIPRVDGADAGKAAVEYLDTSTLW